MRSHEKLGGVINWFVVQSKLAKHKWKIVDCYVSGSASGK
jgi:hypothetical protein